MQPTTFNELFPELFPIIFTHIPLPNRVPTLFSLALTCHRLHDIIIPHVLYNDVRLVGEEQAITVLKRFIEAAKDASKDNTQTTTTPSQCIHHLCIDRETGTSLAELQKLIDVYGLMNLTSLTLHIEDRTALTTDLLINLKERCPRLTGIHLTDVVQDREAAEWIQSDLFSIQGLTSIRLAGFLEEYDNPVAFDLTKIPPRLHTLELRLSDNQLFYHLDAACAGGLLSSVLPNLRVLILDLFDVGKPAMTSKFWKAHPGIERLEFWTNIKGNWFEDFESGMLPNLSIFKSNFTLARIILPHIATSLISLCLLDTYNAQAPYLLRTVPKGGTLPALRSLGIHRKRSGNSPKLFEGHRWREDENGGVTEVALKHAARRFDGNYIMSLAKAAPNLEELELMGDSDDTIDSITASLRRIPKLNRLTLSGPINVYNLPFFKSSSNWVDYADWPVNIPEDQFGKYGPESFERAAYDLAEGCRTLETVTFGHRIGELLIADGLSAKIVRESEGGLVKEVQRIRAWGNIIGKEEEW